METKETNEGTPKETPSAETRETRASSSPLAMRLLGNAAMKAGRMDGQLQMMRVGKRLVDQADEMEGEEGE